MPRAWPMLCWHHDNRATNRTGKKRYCWQRIMALLAVLGSESSISVLQASRGRVSMSGSTAALEPDSSALGAA